MRPLGDADEAWFKRVWKDAPELGDRAVGNSTWFRWKQANNPRHHIDGVAEVAFVDWLLRLDGGVTINNIAVAASARRQGLARALIAVVPRPVRLVTNADNIPSNAFYASLGFVVLGKKRTRTGEQKNVHELF